MACQVIGTSYAQKHGDLCTDDTDAHCELSDFDASDTRTCNVSERECLICDPRFLDPPDPYNKIAGGGPTWYHDVHKGPFLSAPQWGLVSGSDRDIYGELNFHQVRYYECRDEGTHCDSVNDAWRLPSLYPMLYVTLNTHEFKYVQPEPMSSGERTCAQPNAYEYCTGGSLDDKETRESAFESYIESNRAAPVRLSSLHCGTFVNGCNPSASLEADSTISLGMNPSYTKYTHKNDGDCNCIYAKENGCLGTTSALLPYLTTSGQSASAASNDSSMLCCNGSDAAYPQNNTGMGVSMFHPVQSQMAPGCVDYSPTSQSEGEYILAFDYISQEESLGVSEAVTRTLEERCTFCYKTSLDYTETGRNVLGWLPFAVKMGEYATGSCNCGGFHSGADDTGKYISNSGGTLGFATGSHSVSWSGRPDYSMIFAKAFCESYANDLEVNFKTLAGIDCDGNTGAIDSGAIDTYVAYTLNPVSRAQCEFMPTCAYDGSCNLSNSTTAPLEYLALPEERMSHYPQFQIVNRYPRPYKCTYSEDCFNPTRHVRWDWSSRIKTDSWYGTVPDHASGPILDGFSDSAWGDGSNSCSGKPMFPGMSSRSAYQAIDVGTLSQVSHSATYAPFDATNIDAPSVSAITEAKKGRQMGLNYGCTRTQFAYTRGSAWSSCSYDDDTTCTYEVALADLRLHCNAVGGVQLFTKSDESKEILQRYTVATYFYHAVSLFYNNLYKDYEASTLKHETLDLLSLDRAAYKSDPVSIPWVGTFMRSVVMLWPSATLGRRFSQYSKIPDDWWGGMLIDTDVFGRPVKPGGLFALPRPLVLESKNMLEMYLSRDQFVSLYEIGDSDKRNIWLRTQLRGLYNDGMGYFDDNTIVTLLEVSLRTTSPYGTGDFYSLGGGADIVYVELSSPDNGESYPVRRRSLSQSGEIAEGAQVVSYVILVEIVTFSPMLLLYALRYGGGSFSTSYTNLHQECDTMIANSQLVPQVCYDTVCNNTSEQHPFCAIQEVKNACLKKYSRPMSLIFGNSRVSSDVLQLNNHLCECLVSQNLPTYIPLGTSNDVAMCFSGACSTRMIENALQTNDVDTKCAPYCDTFKAWLENGGGSEDFYFPLAFGGSGRERFERLCGSFWKPATGNIDARVLGIPFTLSIGLFLCVTTNAFYAPLTISLWMISVLLIVAAPIIYMALRSSSAECELFGVGKKSVCRLPTWAGGYQLPDDLCASIYDCECASDEACCASCQPEEACFMTPAVSYNTETALSCHGQSEENCGNDSCSALDVAICENDTDCQIIQITKSEENCVNDSCSASDVATCTSKCVYGRPNASYPLASGPNCPDLDTSGTQTCSCACMSGQCINGTRETFIPSSLPERATYTWSIPGLVLVTMCFVFGTWFTINLTVLYGRTKDVSMLVAIPSVVMAWLVFYAGLVWVFGRNVKKSYLKRNNGLTAGVCNANNPEELTTKCVQHEEHDGSTSYNCEITHDTSATNACDTCGAAYKCVRDDNGQNPRCVQVAFGEGDYSNSACEDKCEMNFVCGSDGSCQISTAVGEGLYTTSDCDQQCAYRYSCSRQACEQVEPGSGDFVDASCTDTCGVSNCYSCNHACIGSSSCESHVTCAACIQNTGCSWDERTEPINDCSHENTACFQCRGSLLTASVYHNSADLQDVVQHGSLSTVLESSDDIINSLCQIYYEATQDSTCNAFQCDSFTCSQCAPLHSNLDDQLKTCINSRNHSFLPTCGSADTADSLWELYAGNELLVITDDNYATANQLCRDIPVYVENDSRSAVRDCRDYMQCVGGVCTKCTNPSGEVQTGAMCTTHGKPCGGQI